MNEMINMHMGSLLTCQNGPELGPYRPVSARCHLHRADTGPVLEHYGMLTR